MRQVALLPRPFPSSWPSRRVRLGWTYHKWYTSIVTSAWVVEFFEDDDGCPVRDFLDGLEPAKRAKVLAIIKLLEEYGPTLPFPYSSQIEGKLRELRSHYADEQYRVLYYGAADRSFVLLHAFVKRTKKTPPREIDVANDRMKRSIDARTKKRRG